MLFICGMTAAFTNKAVILEWITAKGYQAEVIFTNILLLAAIAIVLVLNFLIISNKKNNKKQIIINNLQTDIDNINKSITKTITNSKKSLSEKIESLNKLVAQKQNIIKELNMKIEEVTNERNEQNKSIDKMTSGVQNLYYILNNESELELNKQETLNFITCYKLIDSSFVEKLEKADNRKITPKEELFCILHRLDKTPEEIRLMLNLSKDAYRQLKFRAMKRIGNEKGLKGFCDKIQKSNEFIGL